MKNNPVGADSISAQNPNIKIRAKTQIRADMESAPTIHRRKSIRLRGYDYSQAGFYFVTICTQKRLHLFGGIMPNPEQMVLNDAGEMVNKIWYEIVNDFPKTKSHEFTIMPNHIHGIIEIRADMESAPMVVTLPNIVQSFKRHTTIEYIKMVKQNIVPRFDKRIWQRNYWEHIIRNDNEYYRIAQYIMDNPKKWAMDTLNDGAGNQVMEQQLEYNHEAWMV